MNKIIFTEIPICFLNSRDISLVSGEILKMGESHAGAGFSLKLLEPWL